ncbi:hypothetical protein AB0F77_09840 [Streptomyces sp. NPDC026672]|uniref:hypothetical protein n=1 Tax=unclassified Streptomyces TaxID=2593676 RepID=UPI0033DD2C60
MGERQSDGGLPGRPHVHPGGRGSGPSSPPDAGSWAVAEGDAAIPGLEARFAAALRTVTIDADAEQRVLAAFRAAHAAGGGRPARTRRRDDWRPRRARRARLSVRATLSVVLASLTLGGVAFAAIGTGRSSSDGAPGERPGTPPATSAPGTPSGGSTAGAAAPSGRPGTAQDTLAHCRAYEQVEAHGKALDATAWQRLVAAAGGTDRVAAYCAAQEARADERGEQGEGQDGTGADDRSGTPGRGQDEAGNNGQDGAQNGATGNGAGNGQAGTAGGAPGEGGGDTGAVGAQGDGQVAGQGAGQGLDEGAGQNAGGSAGKGAGPSNAPGAEADQ